MPTDQQSSLYINGRSLGQHPLITRTLKEAFDLPCPDIHPSAAHLKVSNVDVSDTTIEISRFIKDRLLNIMFLYIQWSGVSTHPSLQTQPVLKSYS